MTKTTEKKEVTTQAATVLFDGFTALDALGPYQVLVNTPDVEVVFVAEHAGTVCDHASLQLTAHATLAEVTAPDIIVVPGGLTAVRIARSSRPHPVIDWIAGVHPTTVWTTSVCTGAHLLGAAGLLRGHPKTTHWHTRAELARYGAVPTDSGWSPQKG
jgi:putative intracellular protease/amidase